MQLTPFEELDKDLTSINQNIVFLCQKKKNYALPKIAIWFVSSLYLSLWHSCSSYLGLLGTFWLCLGHIWSTYAKDDIWWHASSLTLADNGLQPAHGAKACCGKIFQGNLLTWLNTLVLIVKSVSEKFLIYEILTPSSLSTLAKLR